MICGTKTVFFTIIGVMIYIITITSLYFTQDNEKECLGNATIEEMQQSHDQQLVKLENKIRNELSISGSCLSVWGAYILTMIVCFAAYICVHHRSRMTLSCCCFKVTTGPALSTSTSSTATSPVSTSPPADSSGSTAAPVTSPASTSPPADYSGSTSAPVTPSDSTPSPVASLIHPPSAPTQAEQGPCVTWSLEPVREEEEGRGSPGSYVRIHQGNIIDSVTDWSDEEYFCKMVRRIQGTTDNQEEIV